MTTESSGGEHGDGEGGGPGVAAAGRIEARLRERYGESQYAVVQYLSEHLSDCARTFGGDLAQMLVLAVLGQSTLSAIAREGYETRSGAMSASRLADVTGLPRETVRRKLAALAAKGWIEKQGAAKWIVAREGRSAPARRDLSALDARGLARLARLYAALERVIGE